MLLYCHTDSAEVNRLLGYTDTLRRKGFKVDARTPQVMFAAHAAAPFIVRQMMEDHTLCIRRNTHHGVAYTCVRLTT